VIDYSTTINRFALLDAYPLPNIEGLVNTVAQDKYYSSLDLRSAYHQVPLLPEENQYTAFFTANAPPWFRYPSSDSLTMRDLDENMLP